MPFCKNMRRGLHLRLQNHFLAAEFAGCHRSRTERVGVAPAFRTFGRRERPKSEQGRLERVRKAGSQPPATPCPSKAN